MSRLPARKRRGSAFLEFTLIGIPMIFLVISVFEIGRGMWQYHALAYAVKAGARYAAVHGQNCAVWPNSCRVNISQIAGVIRKAAVGIAADQMTLTFTPPAGTATTCLLSDCVGMTTGYWPPTGANSPGTPVRIAAQFPFRSAIAMIWPGAGKANARGVFPLSAASRQVIEF